MQPIRAFFAIAISTDVASSIMDITTPLRHQYKTDFTRWTESQHFHITLHFLPALQFIHLNELILNVKQNIADHAISTFELELDKLELFPSKTKPLCLILSLKSHSKLKQLVDSLANAIQATGYAVEKRPFRGHLTLARFNRNVTVPTINEIIQPHFKKIVVPHIMLYQSKPTAAGSRYIPLEKIPLCLHST